MKIAEFNHGEQAVIIDCPGYTNNALTPNSNQTTFDTTVCGVYLDFPVAIEDMELLQDGSNQQVILTPSSSQFGNNFTDPAIGCDIAPCATLNGPLINTQQLNLDFQWQTACDHLIGPDGIAKNSVTYEFVLKASDDYCSVPEQTYQTIKILY